MYQFESGLCAVSAYNVNVTPVGPKLIKLFTSPVTWLVIVGLLTLSEAAGAIYNFPYFQSVQDSAIDAVALSFASLLILIGAVIALWRHPSGYVVSGLGCATGVADMVFQVQLHFFGTEAGFLMYGIGLVIAVGAFVCSVRRRAGV